MDLYLKQIPDRLRSLAKSLWPLDTDSRRIYFYWGKRLLIAAVLLLAVANLFSPLRYDDIGLELGTVATRDISAPFDFPILIPPDSLKALQDSAASRVLALAYRDADLDKRMRDDLDRFLVRLADLRDSDQYLTLKKKDMMSWGLELSEKTVSYLLTAGSLYPFQSGLKNVCEQLIQAGILPLDDQQIASLGSEILVRQNDQMVRRPVASLVGRQSVRLAAGIKAQALLPNSEILAEAISEAAGSLLVSNIYVDLAEVEAARSKARSMVSAWRDQVRKGDRIVSAYQLVDEEAHRKLYSLRVKLQEMDLASRGGSWWRYLLTLLSRLLALGFFIGILVFYLRHFRPEIFASFSSLLLLAVIILLTMLASWLVLSHPELSPYLAPAALGPLLATLLFDITLGAVMAVTVSLLLGVVTSFSFPVTVVALASGSVAALVVKGLRGRMQFIATSFAAIALANVLAIAAVEYLRLSPLAQIRQAVMLGPVNALFSVILALVLLPILEGVFRTTTDFSLLELADPDQHLLKRLSIEAPGTFQHSMLVGNLAEAAAKAIGANSLQARIMGYYHDIGKLAKPEYFIENQSDAQNRHDGLAPKMSCLILFSHVKEGLALARAHRLPKPLLAAIAQHHGTALCRFFYQKAIRQSQGTVPPQADFRYPGPKPRTKETGILMLADTVEATVRSLKDRTPARIRRAVKATIIDRANDLELDETNLTLHELNLAGEAFVPVLLAVFHPRIDYPSGDKVAS
jgi:hypothetical protein